MPPLPDVVFTNKLVIYDDVAGKDFKEYDDYVSKLGRIITTSNRYIRYCYPYTFTGDHNISWMKTMDYHKIELNYKPLNKVNTFIYHELWKTFALPTVAIGHVLTIGMEYGAIEYLTQMNYHYKKATCISTNYYKDKLVEAKQELEEKMSNRGIVADVITMPSAIYKLLEFNDLPPADIYTYNNYEYVRHFELNFSHINTVATLVGAISGLKYTKPGGTFIFHLYSLINKIHADMYLMLKPYFETSTLYAPQCVSLFKQQGTWAVFTGFKGISAKHMDHFMTIIHKVKGEYPNGIHSSIIYDPEVRKRCWVSYPLKDDDSKPRVPYISGFLNHLTLKDAIYDEVREFNTKFYHAKLAFCKEVDDTMGKIKYPEHYDIPRPVQVKKSEEYLKHWGYTYTIAKTSSLKQRRPYTYLIKSDSYRPEYVFDCFESRGNWIAYDPKTMHGPVDFFLVDGNYVNDKSLYSIKSNLKSLVGDSKKRITDKNNLYNHLHRIPGARSFLPYTVPFSIRGTTLAWLDQFKMYFDKGRPYICKVVKGGAGLGIITTDKFTEFKDFMRHYYRRMEEQRERFKLYDWVLQEYIDNPWLVDGRKMHLRQTMIYQADPTKRSYYMKSGEYAVAEAPYKKGNWTNKDIHDTHFHKGEGYYWPFHMNFTLDEWHVVKDQFDTIYAYVLSAMENQGSCYEDSVQCFEMLGLDFMITEDLWVYLIEVNDKIGMSPNLDFTDKLFECVLQVVDEYFPPKYVQQSRMSLVPIPRLNKQTGTLVKRISKKMSKQYLL